MRGRVRAFAPRRRLAGAALAAILAAGAAAAQDAPVWSPEAAANLRGFARGFSADCEERCAASGGGQGCTLGCTCLVAEVSTRLDPRTLEAGGKAQPSREDIMQFVLDNREAFVVAYDICEVPLP